jgi:hypothetical protein
VRIPLISNAGTSVGNIVLRPSGALRLRHASTTIGSESTPLSVGRVYRVGVHQKRGAGSNAVLEGYLVEGDAPFGTPFAATVSGTWMSPADRLRIGSTSSTGLNATIDDIRIDTASMPAP